MAKYWSPERQGFYDTDIIGESGLPEDCIYITDEAHAELMSQQCNGCVIVNGAQLPDRHAADMPALHLHHT